jgi:hypothetical protein
MLTGRVNFNQEQSRARSGYTSENLATCGAGRWITFKSDQQKKRRSLKGRMKATGWDYRYLFIPSGLNLNACALIKELDFRFKHIKMHTTSCGYGYLKDIYFKTAGFDGARSNGS